MRIPSLIALLLLLCGGAACGKEIGDSCIISSDCSPNGDRLCLDPQDKGGYCTVQGCDVDTCPDEAVCVRFFTGGFSNRQCVYETEDNGLAGACDANDRCVVKACEDAAAPAQSCGKCAKNPARDCDPRAESTDECSFDELCSVSGTCVPRSSEVRFCMRKCGSNDDCRDEYECRDFTLMQEHGGEPVLGTGVRVTEKAQRFCAATPKE